MSTVPFTPKKDAERPDESTLTDRQRKVLGAIKKHLVEQGFAPSFREIGEAAGLKSPSSVKHQLQVLDDKGFIRMNANKGRAIEVVSFDDDEVSPGKVAQVIPFPSQSDSSGSIMASRDVPLVGRIAAGVPITAEQHVDDVMRLPEHYGQLSALLHVIPLQLLAYHVALVRGTDVDKPRNLAKSVTVE